MSDSHDMALVALSEDGTATTTSLVIAKGTENEHRAVLQLIRNNLVDFEEFGRVAFEMQPFATAGGTQQREVAILTEPQATLLITYMRNNDVVRAFKKRLVHAFYELASRPQQPTLPQSREELLALAVIEADQMIKERDEQIALLAAPAKSWTLLADANGDFSVAEAAKILNRDTNITTGRDRLFAFMHEQKWIFPSRNRRGGWEPYQTAVDTRRLVSRMNKPFLNSKTGEYELPAPTIRVTAKGVGKLHELLGGTDPIRFITGEESA